MAFVAALSLILIIALPPAYIHSSKSRGIFVGIMIPGMTFLYMWILHKWLFAPMEHTVRTLRQNQSKPYEDGPTASTKEMRKLQTAVAILCHENELMRQFSEASTNSSHLHRQSSAIENSVTPQRGAYENPAENQQQQLRLHQSMTPATVARDILRDPGAAADISPPQQQRRDHGISHSVLMDVLSSSTKQQKQKVAIRRKGNEAPQQKDQTRLPQLQQQYTRDQTNRSAGVPGDPFDDERRVVASRHHQFHQQREDYFSPEAFSTPCSDEEDEELHSFPPTPYGA